MLRIYAPCSESCNYFPRSCELGRGTRQELLRDLWSMRHLGSLVIVHFWTPQFRQGSELNEAVGVGSRADLPTKGWCCAWSHNSSIKFHMSETTGSKTPLHPNQMRQRIEQDSVHCALCQQHTSHFCRSGILWYIIVYYGILDYTVVYPGIL